MMLLFRRRGINQKAKGMGEAGSVPETKLRWPCVVILGEMESLSQNLKEAFVLLNLTSYATEGHPLHKAFVLLDIGTVNKHIHCTD